VSEDQNRLVAYSSLMARATVDKALSELPVGSMLPATVLGPPPTDPSGTMYGAVVVQLDRDLPAVTPIEVAVLTESSPVTGNRVMVQSIPPWGMFITHYIAGRNVGVARLGVAEGEAWQEYALDDTAQVIALDCPEIEAGGPDADGGSYSIIVDRPGVYRYDLLTKIGQRNLAGLPMGVGIAVWLYDAADAFSRDVDGALFSFTSTDASSPEWVTLSCHGLCSIPEAGYRLRGLVVTPATTGELWTDGSSHLDLQWVADYTPQQTCSGGGG